MKTKKRILWVTQTAMLLGLTVAAQYYLTTMLSFNTYLSQLVVGSLVNMFLILSTLMCGFWSGFSISVLAPFIALSLGRLPHVWIMPFVAAGNLAIVAVFWLICRKKIFNFGFSINWAVSAFAGSLLKFTVLFFGVTKIFIEFILKNDAALKAPQIAKMSENLSFMFSLPQLASALIRLYFGIRDISDTEKIPEYAACENRSPRLKININL